MAETSRFTRDNLGEFDPEVVIELPLWSQTCGCGAEVFPYQQGRRQYPTHLMSLRHFDCESCGRVWGSYYPINQDGTMRR